MNTGLLRYAVGTVLTVYGIETGNFGHPYYRHYRMLEQCLPFTVLKQPYIANMIRTFVGLEQCLPFTVLKLYTLMDTAGGFISWNSAYRLRY